jgi:molybdopterin synthase sulfur carrier subunit
MIIHVRLFGIARELVGDNRVSLEVPTDSSAADVLAILGERFPAMRELRSLALAVNDEYATADQRLQATDEIALIPPVSGG